jgi:hypothetical protein
VCSVQLCAALLQERTLEAELSKPANIVGYSTAAREVCLWKVVESTYDLLSYKHLLAQHVQPEAMRTIRSSSTSEPPWPRPCSKHIVATLPAITGFASALRWKRSSSNQLYWNAGNCWQVQLQAAA